MNHKKYTKSTYRKHKWHNYCGKTFKPNKYYLPVSENLPLNMVFSDIVTREGKHKNSDENLMNTESKKTKRDSQQRQGLTQRELFNQHYGKMFDIKIPAHPEPSKSPKNIRWSPNLPTIHEYVADYSNDTFDVEKLSILNEDFDDSYTVNTSFDDVVPVDENPCRLETAKQMDQILNYSEFGECVERTSSSDSGINITDFDINSSSFDFDLNTSTVDVCSGSPAWRDKLFADDSIRNSKWDEFCDKSTLNSSLDIEQENTYITKCKCKCMNRDNKSVHSVYSPMWSKSTRSKPVPVFPGTQNENIFTTRKIVQKTYFNFNPDTSFN